MRAVTLTRRRLLGFLGLGGFVTVPDFPDEQTPDAHARAISQTGAPPLVFKRVIDFQVGTNIPASGTLTRPASGAFNLNQPGYEISINVGTAGGAAPVISVELQWYDSGTNDLVDDEIYYFYSGNLNGHFIHGRGPSKGDQVVVIAKNYSTASAVAFSYTLLQTSRTFTREFWKTIYKGTAAPVFPGLAASVMDMGSNVLAGQAFVIGAGGTSTVILPLYTGTVRLFGTTTDTVAGNSQWEILNFIDPVLTSTFTFEASNGQSGFAPFGAGSLFAAEVALPRAQCQLTVNNTSTLSRTISVSMVGQEDRA